MAIDLQATWFDSQNDIWFHRGRFWCERGSDSVIEDYDYDESILCERTTTYYRPVRWNENTQSLEFDMEGGVITYDVIMKGDKPENGEDDDSVDFDTVESMMAWFQENEDDDDPLGDELAYQETSHEVDAVLRPMMIAAHVL